jgi:hypothetical protein
VRMRMERQEDGMLGLSTSFLSSEGGQRGGEGDADSRVVFQMKQTPESYSSSVGAVSQWSTQIVNTLIIKMKSRIMHRIPE